LLRLLKTADCTWIANVGLRSDVVDRGRRGEFRHFDVTRGPIRDHSRGDAALVWGRGSGVPHAGGTDDVVGILIGEHAVIDGGPSGRVVRILFARGLVGEVGTLARIGVIRGEGGRDRDVTGSGSGGARRVRSYTVGTARRTAAVRVERT
jgi:hypothetical protein